MLAPLREAFPSARWSRAHPHLTIVFLGATDPGDVPRVVAAVEGAARATAPFEIELGDAGSFRAGRTTRVAWFGLRRGGPELARLARELGDRLGGEPSRKPFRAHLTIAREADHSLVEALGSALTSAAPISWTADRLVLYRSHLGGGQPRHELVSEARLHG